MTRQDHTIKLFNEVTLQFRVLQAILASDESGPKHQHDAVQQAVHVLETAALAIPRGGEVALVAALALQAGVLKANIRNFEDLHGDGVTLIFTQSLEQAWNQGCAHDLVF